MKVIDGRGRQEGPRQGEAHVPAGGAIVRQRRAADPHAALRARRCHDADLPRRRSSGARRARPTPHSSASRRRRVASSSSCMPGASPKSFLRGRSSARGSRSPNGDARCRRAAPASGAIGRLPHATPRSLHHPRLDPGRRAEQLSPRPRPPSTRAGVTEERLPRARVDPLDVRHERVDVVGARGSRRTAAILIRWRLKKMPPTGWLLDAVEVSLRDPLAQLVVVLHQLVEVGAPEPRDVALERRPDWGRRRRPADRGTRSSRARRRGRRPARRASRRG